MSPEEFANEFNILKQQIIDGYFSEQSEISRIRALNDAGLNENQLDMVRTLMDDALTDALYTVLLGLDGCASIGNIQQSYILKDEEQRLLSGSGELEASAWDTFHGNSS